MLPVFALAASMLCIWAWRYVSAVPVLEHVNNLVGYVRTVPMAYWSVGAPQASRLTNGYHLVIIDELNTGSQERAVLEARGRAVLLAS